MTRVLVTGASGFIGQALVRALVERGDDVRAMVRNLRAAVRVLPSAAEPVEADLRHPGRWPDVMDGIDVVFHLAAAIDGPWPLHEQVTVHGTAALLERAAAADVRRFVHVSSIVVHATAHQRDGDVIDERTPLAEPTPAVGSYARGKLLAERLVREAEHRGLPTTIVRPGLVYGPGKVIFEHLGKPIGPVLVGCGRPGQHLPLTSLHSVIDALLRVADCPRSRGETYLVVDDHPIDRRTHVRILNDALHTRYRRLDVPTPLVCLAARGLGAARRCPGLPARHRLPAVTPDKLRTRALDLRYDSGKLARHTGWAPAHHVADGLRRAASASVPRRPVHRVAVVGAGMNSIHHLHALCRRDDVRIVGLVDTQLDRARALAARCGLEAPCFDSLASLCDQAQPDAAHVVTPPATHESLVCELLERGVDVLCEKPLAITLDACDRMAATAARRARTLGTTHNFLFDERFVRMQAMIAGGAVGQVLHVDTRCAFDMQRLSRADDPAAAQRAGWVWNLPGGLIEDLAPHPIYMTQALLGTDATLAHIHRARTGRVHPDADDQLHLLLAGPRVTGDILVSLTARPPAFTITVHGTAGTLMLDVQDMILLHSHTRARGPRALQRGLRVLHRNASTLRQLGTNAARLATRRLHPPGHMHTICDAYYHALATGHPFTPGPADGAAVVAILRQIWPTPHPTPHPPVNASSV
ncbi:MAG: Gfo/Idh/MocA family oxidoreductase [Phycisphaeraceae bacterium]